LILKHTCEILLANYKPNWYPPKIQFSSDIYWARVFLRRWQTWERDQILVVLDSLTEQRWFQSVAELAWCCVMI